MMKALCGSTLIGMLLIAAPAMGQYLTFWQDPTGAWKGPEANQPGQELVLAQNAAHRACLDRGIPKLLNRASKVTEKATGKEVLLLDCNAERTKKKAEAAPSTPEDTKKYSAYWQLQSGEWKGGTAPRHPGLSLASAKGTAYEACKDRGNPKDLKRAAKVTEKGTETVVLEIDCNAERAKVKAEGDAAKARREALNANK